MESDFPRVVTKANQSGIRELVEFPISSKTDTKKLGSAIFENIKKDRDVRLTMMGEVCIEKGVKGIIAANALLSILGKIISLHPIMEDRRMKREEKVKTVTMFNLLVHQIKLENVKSTEG